MEGQDLGRRRVGNGQNRWEVAMARAGRVRTPGAAGRGSGVPGPLTVIAEPESKARASAVSGAGWDQAQVSDVGRPAPVLRQSGCQGRGGANARARRARGRGSGPRRRVAVGAPSVFQPRSAGGARQRTQREARGCLGADPLPDCGRSARGRRSSGPRAAGYRGPALGADPGPCGRGESIKVLALGARSLLQPLGY